MERISLVLTGLVLGGCISVSHYQTAEPIGRGQLQLAAGAHAVGKDARYGLDEDQNAGAPVSTHMRAAVLLPDVQLAYGVTDRLDVHVQAFPFGGEVGSRLVFLDTPKVKIAAGGAVGAFAGSKNNSRDDDDDGQDDVSSRRSYGGYYADFPMTVTFLPTEALAVNMGPVLTWVQSRKTLIHTDNGVVTEEYTRHHRAWELGFFAGLGIGNESVRFSPGVTFYLEHTHYPIDNFSGDGWFAMPWVGLTIQPKRPKSALQ